MLVSAVACATEYEITRNVESCQAVSPHFVESMEKSTFGQRLKIAFGNANNAQIARKMGVSDSAVTNYMAGRVPDIEKLLLIKSLTNCGLDWLLTGEGEAPARVVKDPTLEEMFERRVREIVREEMSVSRPGDVMDAVDEMDVSIEPAEMILAPVVAHIGPGRQKDEGERIKDKDQEKEEIRKSLVSDEGIREMEKRLKPKRRKTG